MDSDLLMQLTNQYTCEDCNHFLSWNDWGIPCEVKYDDIADDLKLCEKFKAKVLHHMTYVEADDNGMNANIKAHILEDNKMRKLGFTDFKDDTWYFCKRVNGYAITFNVSISKNDQSNFMIDVLDENFLQPYDYQYILSKRPNTKGAIATKKFVDKWMTYLVDNGVLSGWSVGDYV